MRHCADDRRHPTRRHRPCRAARTQPNRPVRRRVATRNRRSPALFDGPTRRSAAPGAFLPGDRAGGSRPYAGQPRRLDADFTRPRPQGHLLPVGRVPDGSSARQQPAESRNRGGGPHRTRGTRRRLRRKCWRARRNPASATAASAGLRRAIWTRWPRWSAHHRLRHPLRVRHLRPGDPRRLAGREDRQLAGQR